MFVSFITIWQYYSDIMRLKIVWLKLAILLHHLCYIELALEMIPPPHYSAWCSLSKNGPLSVHGEGTGQILGHCSTIMPSAHRRICAAQIVKRVMCIKQYIGTGSKPARWVFLGAASSRLQCVCYIWIDCSNFYAKDLSLNAKPLVCMGFKGSLWLVLNARPRSPFAI